MRRNVTVVRVGRVLKASLPFAAALLLAGMLTGQVAAQNAAKAKKKGVRPPMAQPSPEEEARAMSDPRLKWFREAKFGLFIHWGLYAVPAGKWKGAADPRHRRVDHEPGQDPGEGVRAAGQPVQPGEVRRRRSGCRLAQDAGMKYIVITSKHHDGFAMYRLEGEQVQHRGRHAVQAATR